MYFENKMITVGFLESLMTCGWNCCLRNGRESFVGRKERLEALDVSDSFFGGSVF